MSTINLKITDFYDKIKCVTIFGKELYMDNKQKICEYIDSKRDEFIRDLSELVSVKSVKSEAKEGMPFGEGSARCMEKAVEMFRCYGFKSENLGNYAAYCDINENEGALDILGHIDVVGEGDGWDTDPYVATLKDDGCIYGRGTDDDKGPVVAALYAMRAVKELNIPLSKNARLIIGGDEESGSETDLEAYYKLFKPAPATFSPDASFPIYNTEKGSYKPEFAKKLVKSDALPRVKALSGGYRINVLPAKANATVLGIDESILESAIADVTAKTGVTFSTEHRDGETVIYAEGRSTHASTPEDGKNGITALLYLLFCLPLAKCDTNDIVKELSSLFPYSDNNGRALGIYQKDAVSGEITVVLSLLEITEDSVWGSFDSRVPICANNENCRYVFERLMSEKGYTVEGEMGAAHHTPEDGDFIKALKSAYTDFTGEVCPCYSMGGGTYVHNIEGGVAFGASRPDFQSNLHGANERANVDDLLRASKIFALVIEKMCK